MTEQGRPILVVGAGSWGTALALVLARNGHAVSLWGRDAGHIDRLRQQRCNQRFLPDIALPENLNPIADFSELEPGFSDVVMTVPCSATRQVLQSLKSRLQQPLRICLTAKGLEPDTHLPGHQLVEQCLGDSATTLVLSGPSFAKEVAMGLPTAVSIASTDVQAAEQFADYFRNDHFRTYTQSDVLGVEIGGAVKNVMAIAAGIADGLGFGANTRAALITRGLAEILRLAAAMGANESTFMGLAGLGDLVLTCTDDLSRNRRFGLALARGLTVAEAEQQVGQAIEGINTAREVCSLAERWAVDMPISQQVLGVISGQTSPEQAVKNLLQREPRAEDG